jgi:hypothetical protein
MFDNFSFKAFFGQDDAPPHVAENIEEAPLVDMAEFAAAPKPQMTTTLGQVFDDAPVNEVYSAQASVNFWDVVQGRSVDVGADVGADINLDHAFNDSAPDVPSVYDQAVSELDNGHSASDSQHFNIDTLNDILNPTFEMYDI